MRRRHTVAEKNRPDHLRKIRCSRGQSEHSRTENSLVLHICQCGYPCVQPLQFQQTYSDGRYKDIVTSGFMSHAKEDQNSAISHIFRLISFNMLIYMHALIHTDADPSGHDVGAVGLRPLGCCDCSFESHTWHRYLSFVSVVCCQVEFFATN
jgi:hypothetical protein